MNGANLEEGKTHTFLIAVGSREQEAFLLRYEGELLAYLNECPHWAVELDLGDGHFFDDELQRIYCKNHGALFVPPEGKCETGPCLGRTLTRLEIRLEGEDVWVTPR